jgi:hypothetical protein
LVIGILSIIPFINAPNQRTLLITVRSLVKSTYTKDFSKAYKKGLALAVNNFLDIGDIDTIKYYVDNSSNGLRYILTVDGSTSQYIDLLTWDDEAREGEDIYMELEKVGGK